MMNNEDTALVIPVDDDTLMRDAQRLVFDSEHSTAELLDLLTTAAVSPEPHTAASHKAARHVRISEEVTVFHDIPTDLLDLPPALSLLYYVAVAEASAPCLQYVLETLGSPAPPIPRGNALYEIGLRRMKENATWREEKRRAQAEADLRECTFKPEISASAREIAPKGLQTFMQKCIEWKKTAEMRLMKKAEMDRINRGEDEWMTPWKMGDRTRQIVEKARAKGKARGKLWEPRVQRLAGSPRSPAALESALDAPSYRPVIESTSASAVAQMLACGSHRADNSLGGNTNNTNNDNNSSSGGGGGGGAAYLQRVETDQVRRRENLERLRAHYATVAAQRLFEPDTGQPLFEPNALPTVLRDGTRVPFDALSRDERRALIEQLRRVQKDYVLTRFRRERSEGSERRGPRAVDELLAHLLDRSAHERHIARLSAADRAAAPFRPSLSARSERLAQRASRVPVHERPLPNGPNGPNGPHSPNGPHNPNGPNGPHSPSGPVLSPARREEAFRRALARADEWAAARERRLERARREEEERRMAHCSFRPGCGALAQRAGGADTDALAACATSRMRREVEMLRSQAALRDEAFMRSAGGSFASMTLASAPRPSRRSVEEYASTMRSLRDPATSYSPSVGAYGGFDTHNDCGDEEGSEADDIEYDYDDEEDFFDDYGGCDVGEETDMLDLIDSWTQLDAQTDSILKNCQYY